MAALEQEQFTEYLKNPILFPGAFKDWISDWFATNVPKLHVSQVFGFKLQSVKAADEVTATDTIAATAYSAADTDGPNLTDIPNGFYVALFGGTFGVDSGGFVPTFNGFSNLIMMSPVIDGAAPSDDNAALLNGGSNGRVLLLDLTDGDHQHTIGMQYKVVGGSFEVNNRWLYLLKVVAEES